MDPFTTIRNFITFIKVFEISAIFLSVSIVFLLCAYLWDYIEGWMEKPVLLLLICIIGFLPVFLPEGIIGYGLAGNIDWRRPHTCSCD